MKDIFDRIFFDIIFRIPTVSIHIYDSCRGAAAAMGGADGAVTSMPLNMRCVIFSLVSISFRVYDAMYL